MTDLSIVIVSYNTKELLLDCIASINSTVKKHTYEIIVVDNVSNDSTVEAVEKLIKKNKKIKLIKNKSNEGFSKANNKGVKASSGKNILFLNPDTVMFDNTIDGMLDFIKKDKNIGAATCYLELKNAKLDDAAHRGFPTPWNALSHFSGFSRLFPKSKIFAGYSMGYKDMSKPHEVDAVAGAFMLVPRDAGEEIGWWDEDYFWYGEDLDFCYRLKKEGYKVMFVPNFRALHYKGASGGIKKSTKEVSKASSATKQKAQKARFDAMRIFYNKHYKDKYPKFVTSMVLWGINIKHFFAKR